MPTFGMKKRTDRIYGIFPVYMVMPFVAEYAISSFKEDLRMDKSTIVSAAARARIRRSAQ